MSPRRVDKQTFHGSGLTLTVRTKVSPDFTLEEMVKFIVGLMFLTVKSIVSVPGFPDQSNSVNKAV